MVEIKEVRITNLPKSGDIRVRPHTYNGETVFYIDEKVTHHHYITWETPFKTIHSALSHIAQRNK